jgi:hypothetical protein
MNTKTLIAALALLFGANAYAQTVKTETAYINNSDKQGIPKQRTELSIGDLILRHDYNPNLGRSTGAKDVSMIMYSNVIPDSSEAHQLVS